MCMCAPLQTLCMTKGEMHVETHYIDGIINSLRNKGCRVGFMHMAGEEGAGCKCFCVLKLPDCSFVKLFHVGVCKGGGTCFAGACAIVIVLSFNSRCHSYCDR